MLKLKIDIMNYPLTTVNFGPFTHIDDIVSGFMKGFMWVCGKKDPVFSGKQVFYDKGV